MELGTGDWKLDTGTGDLRLGTGDWELETEHWRLRTCHWGLGTGNWMRSQAVQTSLRFLAVSWPVVASEFGVCGRLVALCAVSWSLGVRSSVSRSQAVQTSFRCLAVSWHVVASKFGVCGRKLWELTCVATLLTSSALYLHPFNSVLSFVYEPGHACHLLMFSRCHFFVITRCHKDEFPRT